MESSINKVACSEALDLVVDEMVQIYGGYGYSADYPAEKAYRDSRINRIFEGTNEINRMLIPGQLVKRAMKGQLGLLPAAMALQKEILEPQMPLEDDDAPLAREARLAANAKKVALMVLGTAAQKYMGALKDEQEVFAEFGRHHYRGLPNGIGSSACKEARCQRRPFGSSCR